MTYKPQNIIPVDTAERWVVLSDMRAGVNIIAFQDGKDMLGDPPYVFKSLFWASVFCHLKRARHAWMINFHVFGVKKHYTTKT